MMNYKGEFFITHFVIKAEGYFDDKIYQEKKYNSYEEKKWAKSYFSGVNSSTLEHSTGFF